MEGGQDTAGAQTRSEIPAAMEQFVVHRARTVPIILAPEPPGPHLYAGKMWHVWEYPGMVIKWRQSGSEQEQNEDIATTAAVTFALEADDLTPKLLAIVWNKANRGICVEKISIVTKRPVPLHTDEFKRFEAALERAVKMWLFKRTPYSFSPTVCSFLEEAKKRYNIGTQNGKVMLTDIDWSCRSEHEVLTKVRRCLLDRLSKLPEETARNRVNSAF
jgi:hypothetical protein